MCLLIVKPAGVRIATGLLRRATRAHPDGWGAAWHDGASTRAVKAAQVSIESQRATLDEIGDAPAIVHWRYATHGAVCDEYAHPFALADGWAAHNGVLRGYGSAEMSDTAEFVNTVLSCYRGAADLESDRGYLEKTIVGSRIATIHDDGTIVRLGTGWIKSRSGLLASNSSGFARPAYTSRSWYTSAGECDACSSWATAYRVQGDDTWALCASCARQFDRMNGGKHGIP
jgi:hypothetical protein